MSIFRQKSDQLPIAIFSFFFLMDIAVYLTIDNPWVIITWFLLGIWPKGNICAWNHHHQHYLTFKSTTLNRLLEIMYGFQTGVTSKSWFLHHVLGHHKNYLHQDLDESRWMNKDGSTKSEIGYSFEVAATSYYRIFKVGLNNRRHLNDFLLMAILQICLLGMLFWHNWFNAFFLFLLPMVVGLLLTSWATFDHHSNLDTKNEFAGSRNILDPFYNLMTGNLGFHTAHHVKHGLHWSKVPEMHASIEHLIPKHCYLEAGFPYSWFSYVKKTMPFLRTATFSK
jgi:fatty acid desaturase